MERIELFKAAAQKAAEAMELFPDLKADVFTYEDRVSVCVDYKGSLTRCWLYYLEDHKHEVTLHNLVAEVAAMVVGRLKKELKDVEEERDALAAKLEVLENNKKEEESHEA